MDDIEKYITKYHCLDLCNKRICSRCLKNGFSSTPAFYVYDDKYSIYLCDQCHTICYNGLSWIYENIKDIEKIPDYAVIKILKILNH
jgi:hypothetical protein